MATIGQSVHKLHGPLERWVALDFVLCAVPIVMTWVQHHYYSNRFERNDWVHALVHVAVGLCVLGMALSVHACHPSAGIAGGVSGPDLSSVGRRFTAKDILVSVIEPSRVVSEKYAARVLRLRDGRVVTGRLEPGDYRSPDLHVIPDLLQPQSGSHTR